MILENEIITVRTYSSFGFLLKELCGIAVMRGSWILPREEAGKLPRFQLVAIAHESTTFRWRSGIILIPSFCLKDL